MRKDKNKQLESLILKCKEGNDRFLRLYHRCLLTKEDLVLKRYELFHRNLMDLAVEYSEDDEKEFETILMSACGLRKKLYVYSAPDLGFEELSSGGVYCFSDLNGVEDIYYDPDPAGKEYCLKMNISTKARTSNVDFHVRIENVSNKLSEKGRREYRGYGWFSGYHGECVLEIGEEAGKLTSELSQKCYINHYDTVWKTGLMKNNTGFYWDNIEAELSVDADLIEAKKEDI